MNSSTEAPGKPGMSPHWTTSQKDGVGAARGLSSRVWFTLSRGIPSEIYYPRLDRASVKDMGMLVTDGQSFFSEEKTAAHSVVTWLKDGVPGFHLTNTCRQGRYIIEKDILTDPRRHVLLQKTRFIATKGSLLDYHLYVLLAPHLGNKGMGNNARVGEFKGHPMLLAERDGCGLALACSSPWLLRSAGYVGVSDGWQDLHAHKRMTWQYDTAPDGDVALTGEIDLSKGNEFLLALGFGRSATEAAHRAEASLNEGFDVARRLYEEGWTDWQKSLRPLHSGAKANSATYRASTAVLAVHESKDFEGGAIASLSLPWGEVRGDKDQGGYHLVWPRDAYETASAMLAAGATEEVVKTLRFFETTQEADGHWPQNMWLDGTEFRDSIQLDETAAPILLFDLARRNESLPSMDIKRFWPMVRKAAACIVRSGPSTPQDRWEENAGLTAYTLGSLVAALLIAADMADQNKEPALAAFFRESADAWNDSIERWTYVQGTKLARDAGVSGYYVRLAPPCRLAEQTPLTEEEIKIANKADGGTFPADQIVSVDALSLVRFGLRAANDPKILNTVRVIDKVLKVQTPRGPCWHRYNHDGYGESADGSPFKIAGVGRAWPLLTGERAHYEIAAGKIEEARRLLGAMEALASDTGLISEQVWDTAPIPDRDLFPGRPSGSARPLVWAHAEHIKLLRSLNDKAVFDMPPQTVKRYLVDKKHPAHAPWRFDAPIKRFSPGRILRLEATARFRARWTADGWKTSADIDATDLGIDLFFADLPTQSLPAGTPVVFTFYWTDAAHWEGRDFTLTVNPAPKQ